MDESSEKQTAKIEGYRHSREAHELIQRDQEAHNRELYMAFLTTINHYKKQFSSNKLLAAFPFASFPKEEQYWLAKKIQSRGTGAMLSAVSNIRKGGEGTDAIPVAWDEDAIEKMLQIIAEECADDTRPVRLQTLVDLYDEAAQQFHKKVFPAALAADNYQDCVYLFQMAEKCLNLTLDPKQPDAVLFYARYIEACIRAIVAAWFSMSSEENAQRMAEELLSICDRTTYGYYPKNPNDIVNIGLKQAFQHFLLYLKYAEPFVMEHNIKKAVYMKLKEVLPTWDYTKLRCFEEFGDKAVLEGFSAVGVRPNADKIKTVKNLFRQLSDRFVAMDSRDSATWAVLCYICYQCSARDFPVKLQRKRSTGSVAGVNYNNGQSTSSISAFAKSFSALQPGEYIENDMRLNYLVQIAKIAYVAVHGWFDDTIAGVEVSMDYVSDAICRILLLYDAELEATLLNQLLERIWQHFLISHYYCETNKEPENMI